MERLLADLGWSDGDGYLYSNLIIHGLSPYAPSLNPYFFFDYLFDFLSIFLYVFLYVFRHPEIEVMQSTTCGLKCGPVFKR